ncbi:MAG: 2-C-methyl-D-erythritol 4-phosphate cytidylyltransferase [Bacteroidia bacterium]|nr:2-C-methyl-D-erythritol 4-phosphate cytidylyltransferase [Bacteroidia bacterium]
MILKTALLVAGGTGSRMGGVLPKQFMLLNHLPVLVLTIRRFRLVQKDMPIVIVMHEAYLSHWESLAGQYLSEEERENLYVCNGGKERIHSVYKGLLFLKENILGNLNALVAIHDAVRPFVSTAVIEECFEKALEYEAAIPCLPVKFSLRRIIPVENGETTQPVSRAEYMEVQTPQTFTFSALWDCFEERKHDDYTDDASLFQEVSGKNIAIVKGDYHNIKITTPEDMLLGEIILKEGT